MKREIRQNQNMEIRLLSETEKVCYVCGCSVLVMVFIVIVYVKVH